MVRHPVTKIVAAASVLLVAVVLGMAAKIGRDTSAYLQSVSTARDWSSVIEDSDHRPRAAPSLSGTQAAEEGAGKEASATMVATTP